MSEIARKLPNMCGRYTDTKRQKSMLASLGLQADLGFVPRYNIAPTQEASIIVAGDCGSPEHKRARWGLVPPWGKDETVSASFINARCETAAVKPTFRNAYHKRRCLVLADGFYEWQKRPEGKQPTYIRMREGEPFAFGGLWEQWRDCERLVETFCIVTTPANELCATVHDRMPLILRAQDYSAWLDANTAEEQVAALMRPHAAARMECYPVSPLINSVRNETAACVERSEICATAGPEQMLLF